MTYEYTENKVVVECAHCGGSGTCEVGPNRSSCRSCQNAAGLPPTPPSKNWLDERVMCSCCKGSGKQLL